MLFFNLLFTFLKIGLFSFGGGSSMLPLLQQEVIIANKWITHKEFIDIIAVSRATPGPIAINTATYIGYNVDGIFGSLAATLGIILPSFIIILIMLKFFFKFRNNKYVNAAFLGIKPAIVGLVSAAAILVAFGSFIDYKSIIIFLLAFLLTYKFKIDPILMIVLAGCIGYFIY